MRLIGREKLLRLRDKGAEAERWVRSWVAEVAEAHWRKPDDVTSQFPNARQRSEGYFVFPVGQCGVAILLHIAFPQGIALISDLDSNDVTYGS